jgi:predicted PurR-regulated permease PerM
MKLIDEFPPLVRTLVGLVLVGLALALISWAGTVLTPILLAWYLAALSLPGYFWLQKRGVKSGLAMLLLIAVLLIGGIAIGVLVIVSVDSLQEGLETYLGSLDDLAGELQTTLDDVGIPVNRIGWSGKEALGEIMRAFLAAILEAVKDFFFSLILVAFLLLESGRFRKLITEDLADRPFFSQMPALMKTAVTYFGIRTRLNLITGIGFALWLVLLGVDYAALWGVLTFVLSYIPYIGLFTAMIPPAILALAEFGPVHAILVVVGAVAINLLIENVMEPSYTGKRLRLSPSVVLISFFIWGWLLGPIGALLSMPITVMLLLVLNQHESTQWLAKIIGRE